MSKLRVPAVSAAIALALTGCVPGSGGGQADPSRPAAASGSPAAAAPTEIQINKSYWYTGFKVTLGAARLVASSAGGKAVTIEGVFQNLSPEHPREPASDVLLTVGDRTYAEPDHQLEQLPEVPAQRSQPGTYAFAVDEHFVLADAVLVVGRPADRQAAIPFTGPDGLVALEPKPVSITGKVLREKSGKVYLTVSAAEVRADEPLLHGEAPTGQEFVRLTFSATNDTAAGFAWVFDRDLHLRLPDGTVIATADNCSRAQIYPAPYATATGGLACFLVPSPASGEYLLTWNRYAKGALRVPID
ncbi:hypothetical protein [Catellatospora coxensis]|nr:hypothetical protein [Catellatospora coxensis]